MIALSIALVVIAALALWGFRMWLSVEYPAGQVDQGMPRRVASLEERLSTLELQRGITRSIKAP